MRVCLTRDRFRRRLSVCLGCCVCLLAGIRLSAQVSEADIDAAIAAGHTTRELRVVVDAGTGGFRLALTGPLQRVALAVQEAATKYLPFARADVAADLITPTLLVLASPNPPAYIGPVMGWRRTPIPTHVVLRARDGGQAVQPIAVRHFPVSWNNAAGGTLTGDGLAAEFPLASLPAAAFAVMVVHPDGEQRYTIDGKKRAQIR